MCNLTSFIVKYYELVAIFVFFRRVFRFVSVRIPWNIFTFIFMNHWPGLSNGLLAELYKEENFA